MKPLIVFSVFQISEARPISHRFLCGIEDPDSDSGNDRDDPTDKLKTPFTNSPIAAPQYSRLWKPPGSSDIKKLYVTNPLSNTSIQRNDINNPKGHVVTGHEENQYLKNGGKSCHPKMRAKFMFRTGDLENYDWGYDWSSSDNESLKSKRTTSEKNDTVKEKENEIVLSNSRYFPLKRRWTNSFDEESVNSETTIPAVDDLETPAKCSKVEPDDADLSDIESCPTEVNFTDLEETVNCDSKMEEGDSKVAEVDSRRAEVETDTILKKDDDVILVTEVTHNLVTITFLESSTEKGFFKEWSDG